MSSLGNKRIASKSKSGIQIAKPEAAKDLLNLAVEAAEQSRRVIFFCSCVSPKTAGKVSCHRWPVGSLLLQEAQRRKMRLKVIEWPGGDPEHFEFRVSPKVFDVLQKGAVSLSLGTRASRPVFGGMAWYSPVTIHSKKGSLRVLSGPAEYSRGGWQMPFWEIFTSPTTPISICKQEAGRIRDSFGLEERTV